jgi:hypothetical protein
LSPLLALRVLTRQVAQPSEVNLRARERAILPTSHPSRLLRKIHAMPLQQGFPWIVRLHHEVSPKSEITSRMSFFQLIE